MKLNQGRFVGIAWKHGNPFTFRIWTEPDDDDWSKGKELIRNVVRPRKPQHKSQEHTDVYDDLDFRRYSGRP